MAETTTKTPAATVQTFKFDKARCSSHLAQVRAEVEQHAGKPNVNPYLWIGANLDPLKYRLEKGEETKELQEAILNLNGKTIPWVPGYKPAAT